MSTSGATSHLGEVIIADSVGVTVQSVTDFAGMSPTRQPASLGSFVCFSAQGSVVQANGVLSEDEPDPFLQQAVSKKASPGTTFGVVTNIQTSSLEHGRRATAYGIATEEELRQSQPQIFELLTTEFYVVLTSFADSCGKVHHRLPPRPPRIHSFVYPCELTDIQALTEEFGYFRCLMSSGNSVSSMPIEDIVAATILRGWEARDRDEKYLIAAGKALLRQLANDYERFKVIMQQVSSAASG